MYVTMANPNYFQNVFPLSSTISLNFELCFLEFSLEIFVMLFQPIIYIFSFNRM